jgi:hypothetical protein
MQNVFFFHGCCFLVLGLWVYFLIPKGLKCKTAATYQRTYRRIAAFLFFSNGTSTPLLPLPSPAYPWAPSPPRPEWPSEVPAIAPPSLGAPAHPLSRCSACPAGAGKNVARWWPYPAPWTPYVPGSRSPIPTATSTSLPLRGSALAATAVGAGRQGVAGRGDERGWPGRCPEKDGQGRDLAGIEGAGGELRAAHGCESLPAVGGA